MNDGRTIDGRMTEEHPNAALTRRVFAAFGRDPKAISAIDGKPGAYVSLNGGQRYKLGEWPPGEPQLPGR